MPSIDHFITEKEDGLPLDVRIRIVAAIERLGELQRRVVEGIFYQGKSQAEVGKDLGISQRQVSRMKEAALRALRDKLEPKKDAE